MLTAASAALSAIRGLKHERKLSLRAPLARVVLCTPEAELDRLHAAAGDIAAAGRIAELSLYASSDDMAVRCWCELPPEFLD